MSPKYPDLRSFSGKNISKRYGDAVFAAIIADIEKDAASFIKMFALETYRMVLSEAKAAASPFGSPVWTGTYQASHNLSVGTPVFVSERRPQNAANRAARNTHHTSAASKYKDAAVHLATYQLGQSIFITNAAQDENGRYYAQDIEERSLSAKTPNGVFRVAAERASLLLKATNITYRTGAVLQ